MSAEKLRQAAAEIRAKAEDVRRVRRETPGEMHGGPFATYGAIFIENAFANQAPGDADDPDLRRIWRADARHLSLWQDVDIALAVADWLDSSANHFDQWHGVREACRDLDQLGEYDEDGRRCECSYKDCYECGKWHNCRHGAPIIDHALAVADAILGDI